MSLGRLPWYVGVFFEGLFEGIVPLIGDCLIGCSGGEVLHHDYLMANRTLAGYD